MAIPIKTTIDGAGRVVIPKAIREAAGLSAHMPVQVSYRGAAIEIEVVAQEVRLQDEGGILVAFPSAPFEPLTSAAVERIRAEIRDRSDGS